MESVEAQLGGRGTHPAQGTGRLCRPVRVGTVTGPADQVNENPPPVSPPPVILFPATVPVKTSSVPSQVPESNSNEVELERGRTRTRSSSSP